MQQESSQFLYTIFVFMYKELDWKIDEPLENVFFSREHTLSVVFQ